jgi:hypothetical protein
MSLQMYRPDGQGGLRPGPRPQGDWRKTLRSRRWRVAPLRNPEMNPTPTFVSIIFWAALAALTFCLLLVGYGSGFWR